MPTAPAASPSVPGPDARPRRRTPVAVASLLVTALVAALAAPVHAQDPPTTTTDAAEAAAGWLAGQLVDGERFEVVFGEDVFVDQGLTIDAILALTAAGVADDVAEAAMAWLLQPEVYQPYLGFGPGAAGKFATVLLARGLLPESYPDAGGDTPFEIILAADTTPFDESNDYFNLSVNVAWAVIALHRAGFEVPEDLVDLLIALQCEDGSFHNPFPPAGQDSCPGGVDGTAFGLQALLLVAPESEVAASGGAQAAATQQEVDDALAAALASLLAAQDADGGLAGGSPNSTDVAAQAFAAAGQTDAAASAAAFLASIQLLCAAAEADRGAFPVDGEPDARATAQAVPGLLTVALVDLEAVDAPQGAAPVLDCTAAGPVDVPPPAGPGRETPVPETEPGPIPASPTPQAAQAAPTFAG